MCYRWADESEFRLHFASVISRKAEFLAEKTGRSASYWYKVAEGTISFIPDDIPLIDNLLDGYPLISWLIDRTSGACLKQNCVSKLNGSICDEIEEATIAIGRLIERRQAAYADGRVDGLEKQQLIDAANNLHAITGQLLEETKSLATGKRR